METGLSRSREEEKKNTQLNYQHVQILQMIACGELHTFSEAASMSGEADHCRNQLHSC